MLMQTLNHDQFIELIRTLSTDRSQHLTEASFEDKQVILNPEWRCPLCITTFEGPPWGLQAMLCDTRTYPNNEDEICIAPLGHLSPPVEKAFGYLKIVALMNELEGNENFRVQDIIDAIGRINARYVNRNITSQSVCQVKSWIPEEPTVPEYAATTSKKLLCISSQLSI